MWFDIFMVVLGSIATFVVGVCTADCYFNYKKSGGNEKKVWKRALQGWGLLLFVIVLDLLVDISALLSSIIN